MGLIVAAIDKGHDQADADTKHHREDDAGNGNVHADGHASVGHSQDIDGRADEQKGDGRPQPGALGIDAGEKGQDGAGTDGQHKPACRGHGIGEPGGRIASQVAGDSLLGDQGGHSPGDKERRNQAEQDVGRQVGGQAAHARLKHCDDNIQDRHASLRWNLPHPWKQ